MTLAYRVWSVLRVTPSSIGRIAARLDLPYKQVAAAFLSLRRRGHIVRLRTEKCDVICGVTDKPMLPDGRGQQAGSRASLIPGGPPRPKVKRLATAGERRSDKPIRNGYGGGTIELERVWRS